MACVKTVWSIQKFKSSLDLLFLTRVRQPAIPCSQRAVYSYRLTWVSLTLGLGYLFTAAPAKHSCCSLDTCISLFTAALFTIARTWKQPRCSSTDEWIKKLLYICTMEYYSAIKRNAFESVLMRWMNLEPILQSEVSQKDKYHILKYICGI